jgi:para-nitrobenzyl esterase
MMRPPGVLAMFLGCVAACRAPATPARLGTERPRVETDRGPLEGKVVEAGVRAFLGVPYAAPPVGALRWRPPADVMPWSRPRDATKVGAACPG